LVPAFTAIELIPLPVSCCVEMIVARPAMEDVLSLVSAQEVVVAIPAADDIIPLASDHVEFGAVAPVEHVIVPSTFYEVPLRPAVDDVAAYPSEEFVYSAEAAYLVVALLTAQEVLSVGAREQAALGAAGQVIREVDYTTHDDGPRPLASAFLGHCSA
jgi:hypothetical protein